MCPVSIRSPSVRPGRPKYFLRESGTLPSWSHDVSPSLFGYRSCWPGGHSNCNKASGVSRRGGGVEDAQRHQRLENHPRFPEACQSPSYPAEKMAPPPLTTRHLKSTFRAWSLRTTRRAYSALSRGSMEAIFVEIDHRRVDKTTAYGFLVLFWNISHGLD